MSKGFSINDILGSNAKAAAPAGQKMQVVMLPAADIEPNPENSIYEIGDVEPLKESLAKEGVRNPLEVLPAQNGKYMLIAGHRRWTACRELAADGVAGFDLVPCVIRSYQNHDDEVLSLITSNITNRELTQGEKLRQYEALKKIVAKKKADGEIKGRVRDEVARIMGKGTGSVNRLEAISGNCVPEVRGMYERGEITEARAYECSKLYKVQQTTYAKNGYAPLPEVSDDVRKAAILYIVDEGVADQLRGLDYVQRDEWNYADGGKLDAQKMETVTLDMTDNVANAILRIAPAGRSSFTVEQLDPADQNEVIAKSCIYSSHLYRTARSRYIDKKALEKYKAEEKAKKDAERTRHDAAEKWLALARQELADFDNWKLTARHKDLGLTIRERKMFDGGRLVIAVDDTGRYDGPVNGFPYRECFSVRLGPDGERVGRDGGRVAPDWSKRWYSTGAGIEGYIADDIQQAAREAKKK